MVKKVITTEEVQDDGTEEQLEPDVIRALAEMEGSGEIRWQVHCTAPPGPNLGYRITLSTGELTLERIAELGPGKYRVIGFKPDGKIFKSRTLEIGTSPNQQQKGNPELVELLKSQGGGGDKMHTLLLAMMQQNTGVITAALARPEPPKKEIPWTALLTAAPLVLTAIKDFFKNNSENDATERLLKQLTVLEKLKGDGDGKGASWPDVVREALSGVSTLVANRGNGPGSAQPIAARTVGNPSSDVLPAPGSDLVDSSAHAATMVETPVAVEPTEQNLMFGFAKDKLAELIRAAAKNRDPELQADLLIEEFESLPKFLSDEMILAAISRDDWFEQVCAFDKNAAPYFGWFSKLREYILDYFRGEPRGNDDTDESGDLISGDQT